MDTRTGPRCLQKVPLLGRGGAFVLRLVGLGGVLGGRSLVLGLLGGLESLFRLGIVILRRSGLLVGRFGVLVGVGRRTLLGLLRGLALGRGGDLGILGLDGPSFLA